ncbi:uncharacterized protein LOC126800333 [Argentina anserina]|uniref:uncharacterized protein LOC126800333 n=1 Tax=Argentina anserina TaxID=57926 RepID=UPI002176708B|nr:uncharacterized protein LOC126800333 [Potentilla anserina]
MATENWQVVSGIICNTKYLGKVQPTIELPNTKFLMDFKIKIVHVSSRDLEGEDEVTETRTHCPIELEYNPQSMWVAINHELQNLQVPSRVREVVEDPILMGTRVARAASAYYDRKYLHMEVDIEFQLGDFDGIGDYEPLFVPASEVSISKLENTKIEECPTMCTVCVEDMMLGSEATRMPCSHLYHESCIVEWLRKSGVCPSCKFRMPTEDDNHD